VLGLVEIEVLRRDLEKEVAGRRIKDVEIRPGSNAMKILRRHGRRKEFQELLVGAKVEKVERIGRRLMLGLDNERVLVIDLAESGRLVKTSASDAVETHTHIVIAFTIGGQLRVLDPKKSAEIYVLSAQELEESGGERDFLIDPLEHQFTWQHFSTLLEEREAGMKHLMMDEKFITGLGEIYSDEVLFVSALRYDRMSNKLSSQDVRRLYRALMETLQDALKANGTTWGEQDFRDLQGNPGQYQLELKVYEREGEACRRCRTPIVKEKVEGVYTYFCPQCQS
jgi:formamidopyrimidine-DNA glycosylase